MRAAERVGRAVGDRVYDEVSLVRRPCLRARSSCEMLGDGIGFQLRLCYGPTVGREPINDGRGILFWYYE